MTAGRKRDAVLRLLRGEPLEIVVRELAVTAADLSAWRDAFLETGEASLKTRARDDRDETIDRLRHPGGRTDDGRRTASGQDRPARGRGGGGGGPFGPRRSKR